MTIRPSRDTKYIVVTDRKPKIASWYRYEDDYADDSPIQSTTRRVVQTKPMKDQRFRYVTMDNHESDRQRQDAAESDDHGIKMRTTANGEQVILDEDDNIIKIIRNTRTRRPPVVEKQHLKVRPRRTRAVYYENSDGHLVARPTKNHDLKKTQFEYLQTENEPTRIMRRLVIDNRRRDQDFIYNEDSPRKLPKQKYIVRHVNEIPIESDNEYEQQEQPRYVHMVQRPTVPKQTAPTKYLIIRKKIDSKPTYAVKSSVPTVKSNRRLIYETSTKNQ